MVSPTEDVTPMVIPMIPPMTERHGLYQELHQDVERTGANRHPDTNLASAFRHRNKHDVHDPNAANYQRDSSYGCQHGR